MLPDVYGLESTTRTRLRPIGVTIIASLWGFAGVIVTLRGLARLLALFTSSMPASSTAASVAIGVAGCTWLVIGFSILSMSIGLLQLHRWARIACLVLTGMSGGVQLLGCLLLILRSGMTATLPLGLSTVATLSIVWYLVRGPIKAAFQNPPQPATRHQTP